MVPDAGGPRDSNCRHTAWLIVVYNERKLLAPGGVLDGDECAYSAFNINLSERQAVELWKEKVCGEPEENECTFPSSRVERDWGEA